MAKPLYAVRSIDDLGRIVIPIEMRRALRMSEHDLYDIYSDGEQIVIRKKESETELRNIIKSLMKAVEKRKRVFGPDVVLEIENTLGLIEQGIMNN